MIGRFSDEHTERISVKNRLNKRKLTWNNSQISDSYTSKTPENTAFSSIFRGFQFGVPCAIRTRGLQSRRLQNFDLMLRVCRGFEGVLTRLLTSCMVIPPYSRFYSL